MAQTLFREAVRDIDGNVYNAVRIGKQFWMKENLRVTRYNNGDSIRFVTDSLAWAEQCEGSYCNFHNSPELYKTYGRMYNFYAVGDERKLCPQGWHVPSDDEWQILCDYLGGFWVAGGKMKEAGEKHWHAPNDKATNESGFTALPAGRQYHHGFFFLGEYTNIWSSTEFTTGTDTDVVWCRYMTMSHGQLVRFTYKKNYGLSVRCLKD